VELLGPAHVVHLCFDEYETINVLVEHLKPKLE
jgi:hypothetical protein